MLGFGWVELGTGMPRRSRAPYTEFRHTENVDFLVKCCSEGLLKIIKLMLILGKVRLNEG